MNYAVRITYGYKELETFYKATTDVCSKVIVYEHVDAARLHCHALLEECTVSTDTLKNWIKKALGVTQFDKKNWSFKTANSDYKYVTYMSKGKYDAKLVKGYSPEQVAEWKAAWEAPKSDGTLKQFIKIQEKPEVARKRQSDLVDEMVSMLNEDSSTMDIIEVIRKVVIIKHQTICGRYKVRDYVDVIKARLNKHTWLEKMTQFCEL